MQQKTVFRQNNKDYSLQQVDHFFYLGTPLTKNNNEIDGIRCITVTNKTFYLCRKFWKIKICLKFITCKTVIQLVLCYG